MSFCEINIIGAYVAGVCAIVTIFGHQNELSYELGLIENLAKSLIKLTTNLNSYEILVHILYFDDQDEAMIIHSYISTFTGYLFYSPPDFEKTNSLNRVITNTY